MILILISLLNHILIPEKIIKKILIFLQTILIRKKIVFRLRLSNYNNKIMIYYWILIKLIKPLKIFIIKTICKKKMIF